MSGIVDWIVAAADQLGPALGDEHHGPGDGEKEPCVARLSRDIAHGMAIHNFPGRHARQEEAGEQPLDRNPDLWLYRGRTAGMLRRYLRFSLDVGRVPSLLGRDFFRSRVTSYSAATFEDRAIFVHDMERSLERLGEPSRQVLARVILQEYQRDEAARLLHCGERTIYRRLVDALDEFSEILLEVGLLEPVPRCTENVCQEGEEGDFLVSGWNEEK